MEHRTRFEARLKTDKLSLTSYIACHTPAGRKEYLALYGRLRTSLDCLGKLEVRSHLARLATAPWRIDYWSMYAKTEQALAPGLRLGFKITYRYDRTGTNSYLTTVAVEIGAQL